MGTHRKKGEPDPEMEYQVPQEHFKYCRPGFSPFYFLVHTELDTFSPWWRFLLHLSTDIKVNRPPGISAFFHVLEMVRAASSSFVEWCKSICCPSPQERGGELDIFCHIPPVSSWCTISRTLLQIQNICLYCLPCQHADGSSNVMLTFHIERSLFQHVQEMS